MSDREKLLAVADAVEAIRVPDESEVPSVASWITALIRRRLDRAANDIREDVGEV